MRWLLADMALVGWNAQAAMVKAFEGRWGWAAVYLGFTALFAAFARLNWRDVQRQGDMRIDFTNGSYVRMTSTNADTVAEAAVRIVRDHRGGAS